MFICIQVCKKRVLKTVFLYKSVFIQANICFIQYENTLTRSLKDLHNFTQNILIWYKQE